MSLVNMDDYQKKLLSSYDALAREYTDRFFHELGDKPTDRRLLDRLIEHVDGLGPICDLGCGPGQVARYLKDHGAEVFGLDLSPGMTIVAHTLNPDIRFRQGNMMDLEDGECSWGGIAAFYSIIHIPRARVVEALVELKRVLRPGGRIFALEQVSFADESKLLPECTLRLEDYLGVMEDYFSVQRAYPIRGARKRSFAQKLAVKRKFPEFFYPFFAYWESRRTKKLDISGLSKYPYVDYVFYGVVR